MGWASTQPFGPVPGQKWVFGVWYLGLNLNIDTASKYLGLLLFSKLRKNVSEIPGDLVLGSFRKGATI